MTRVAALALDQARGQAATKRLSSSDITDIMTGEKIRITGGPGDDALILQISGSPADLETGLKLAHALLTDAKLEESAFKTWQERSLQQLAMAEKMPQFGAVKALREITSGGDPRRALPTTETIERQNVADGQAWLEQICKTAPIEVAVVGDVTLDDAMRLIAKYIGSLPSRPRTAERLDALRKLDRQAGPLEKRVTVPTITPQGVVLYGFVGCDAVAVDDAHLLQIAATTLDTRLIKQLREERGLVYSIQVQNEPGLAYEDAGMFVTGAPCDPAKVDEVLKEIETLFRAFAESEPTAEELDNARKQLLNQLDKETQEPVYWWRVLQNHDLHKVDLAKLKSIKDDLAAFTAENVRDAFRKYYTPERTISVVTTPTPPASMSPVMPTTQPAAVPAP